MILVTVGTTLPFDRLVHAADGLAALIDEPMIIQCGAGSCEPRFAQHVDFVDGFQMQTWLSEARVVISHSGVGSIINVLHAGKPLVLVPRMHRLGEHIDDHQFELAEAMAERERAVMVTELSDQTLAEAVDKAVRLNTGNIGETSIHAALRGWLAEQARQPQPWPWRLLRRKSQGG
jgi:UDP-N-acetylglucosamine transferase subunit ALG13